MTNSYHDSTPPSGGERRSSGRRRSYSYLRATVLFVLSAVIFIFSVIMCLHLIRKSGETEPIPTQAMTVKPLEYEVNTPPTLPVTQPEDDPYQLELKKPESNHDSPVINILLLGVDKDLND
ncbi:MAG: hypothetical protein IKM59_00255, partial [Oscillospiraceae bacterium]|nr:hypothetical protein [Oscillospiraceae bacterium]